MKIKENAVQCKAVFFTSSQKKEDKENSFLEMYKDKEFDMQAAKSSDNI